MHIGIHIMTMGERVARHLEPSGLCLVQAPEALHLRDAVLPQLHTAGKVWQLLRKPDPNVRQLPGRTGRQQNPIEIDRHMTAYRAAGSDAALISKQLLLSAVMHGTSSIRSGSTREKRNRDIRKVRDRAEERPCT